MIEQLNKIIPRSNCKFSVAENIYIVDYKNINQGIVELHENRPNVDFVYISNKNKVEIFFNGFLESALDKQIGDHSSQCECIIFSHPYSNATWTLFIETKYTNSIESAFNENYDYPNCMIKQVIDTVNFFRDKKLIGDETVNAIVSFPKLIDDFNAFFFTGDLSIEDILIDHKIKIRATNSAHIISNKRIKL